MLILEKLEKYSIITVKMADNVGLYNDILNMYHIFL